MRGAITANSITNYHTQRVQTTAAGTLKMTCSVGSEMMLVCVCVCVLPVRQQQQLCPPRSPHPVLHHSIPILHLLFYGVSHWSQELAEPTHKHTQIYTHTVHTNSICLYTHKYMHIQIYILYICVCICICVYIYIYIYIYTHTHTHT